MRELVEPIPNLRRMLSVHVVNRLLCWRGAKAAVPKAAGAHTRLTRVLLVISQLLAGHRSLALTALDSNVAGETADKTALVCVERLHTAHRAGVQWCDALCAEEVAALCKLAGPSVKILTDWTYELFA